VPRPDRDLRPQVAKYQKQLRDAQAGEVAQAKTEAAALYR